MCILQATTHHMLVFTAHHHTALPESLKFFCEIHRTEKGSVVSVLAWSRFTRGLRRAERWVEGVCNTGKYQPPRKLSHASMSISFLITIGKQLTFVLFALSDLCSLEQ